MGLSPGAKRHPNTGRKRGGRNKLSERCQEIAEELGVDPFEVLLRFAAGDEEGLGYGDGHMMHDKFGKIVLVKITPYERIQAAKEACPYLYPKLSSVSISDVDGKSISDTLAEVVKRVSAKRHF